ncbi:unnamed protein product [Prunus armeniaca]
MWDKRSIRPTESSSMEKDHDLHTSGLKFELSWHYGTGYIGIFTMASFVWGLEGGRLGDFVENLALLVEVDDGD